MSSAIPEQLTSGSLGNRIRTLRFFLKHSITLYGLHY